MEAFLRFLDGAPHETCGDKGSICSDVLKRTLQLAIYGGIQKARALGADNDSDLLFLSTRVASMIEPLEEALGLEFTRPEISAITAQWWQLQGTFFHYSDNPPAQTSEVRSLVQSFLQDLERGDTPNSENDDRILRISHDLLKCMREHANQPTRLTQPSLTEAAGGMTLQDGTDGGMLDVVDWQQAWNQPFRGRALNALETKLQLNAHAIRTDSNKVHMSRIIPVVQASGTGKSRLAEEHNFGIMLSLKNGSGFPNCDKYVSEYFKNALDLGRNLVDETPPDVKGLDKKKKEPRYHNHNLDEGVVQEEFVYHGNWRFQSPSKDAVPSPWSAGARLRVACFFIGLFETMVVYMDNGMLGTAYKWRTAMLHEPAKDSFRRQFWRDVINVALHNLQPGTEIRTLMESWLYQDEPSVTNDAINLQLQWILRGPIQKFFEHPVTTQCLDESRKPFHGPSGRASPIQQVVPFLFIMDEAAYLYQQNYMHSFMWVLDQPIMKILSAIYASNRNASNFFVLMLGTHSQISHFAPHHVYPSERYFTGAQHIASVFLSMDWDLGLTSINGPYDFRASSHICHLVRWGRPLWTAVYDGRVQQLVEPEDQKYKASCDLVKCVMYAAKKLLPVDSNRDELDLSAFAILAIRLHLDLDFVYPSRASKLVSSKMRWLVDVDPHRKHIVTTYGSEPLLVEGAALVMNTRDSLYSDPVVELLKNLSEQLNQGFVNRGENGELTARLLLLLAKDQATREAWWNDSDFISGLPDDPYYGTRPKFKKEFRRTGSPHFFREAEYFYQNPSSSHAFYHRAVKVKDFFRALLNSDVFKQLEEHFHATGKWASLDGAYINFTHWAMVDEDHASVPYQKKGFYVSWHRQNAYICKTGFPSIDLVIPMAFPNTDDTITPECMSCIVISVKNCSHTEGIKMNGILPKAAVEGAVSRPKKRKRDNEADAIFTHKNHSLNVRLTLNALKFLSPSSVASADDGPADDERWIEFSEDKPYIAFAMSMAQTDRSENIFAAEEAHATSNRIAFALRGFTNTYEFRQPLIQEILKDILIRQDRSGKYPQSKLEYQGEKGIQELARAPQDQKYRCVDVLCPSSEPMLMHMD